MLSGMLAAILALSKLTLCLWKWHLFSLDIRKEIISVPQGSLGWSNECVSQCLHFRGTFAVAEFGSYQLQREAGETIWYLNRGLSTHAAGRRRKERPLWKMVWPALMWQKLSKLTKYLLNTYDCKVLILWGIKEWIRKVPVLTELLVYPKSQLWTLETMM